MFCCFYTEISSFQQEQLSKTDQSLCILIILGITAQEQCLDANAERYC